MQEERFRPQEGLDEKETKEVIRIMTKFFIKTTGSKQKANEYLASVANMVKNPAAKLVHINDTVFLLLVKDQGIVEFHTMSVDDDSVTLSKNIKKLVDYTKSIGVKKLYSYSDDPKYKAIARRTRLPWDISETTGSDGKDYEVYTLEMQ